MTISLEWTGQALITEASAVHAGLIVRCGNTVPEVAHRASALVFAFLIFARCFWYCFSRLSISDFGTDTMCFILGLATSFHPIFK